MSDSDYHQRISALINLALDLPPAERSAFLERACQGDPQLQEEIESLLSQATPSEGLRKKSRQIDFSGVFADVAEKLAELEAPLRIHPTQIGPYRVLELLGEGGMGAVYLAEQSEPVARRVALKLIHTSLRSPSVLDRFHAERNALARLAHPNIASLHDAGTTEDGFPFFAMEHVPGAEDLTAYCDRRELSVEERLELFLQACRGVQHAHQKGILHRDLKPNNVLVTEDGEGGRVKIIDFGLAKSLNEISLTELTQLTAGRPIGTPAYMSPEAREGDPDLDTRTDVFSLGVVLYELLTGSRPGIDTGAPTPRSTQGLEESGPHRPSTEVQRAEEEIFKARSSTRAELRRRLAGDLDWVVLRALAAHRDERYPGVSALIADIERYLRLEPVSVGPPTLAYQLRKFVRRHRTGVAMSLGGLFLVLVALGALGHTRREADRRTRLNSELNREVERIEWLRRVEHQLPLGTRAAGDQEVRAAMGRIESKSASDKTGLASYALGRGELALGRPASARRHLEASLGAGYEAPETYLALGWTLSELYDRRLETIRRTADPDLRRMQREAADRDFRRPAVEMLGRSRGAGWIAPELLEATLALQEGDLDRAVDRGRAAAERLGWLYEARFVVARALMRQAEETRESKGQLDRAEELYEAAAREVEAALEVGRSDPEGYRLLCTFVGNRLNFAVRYSRPSFDALLENTLAACDRARKVDPEDLEPVLVQGNALLGLAEVQLWDRGEAPLAAVRRAQDLFTSTPGLLAAAGSPPKDPERTAEALQILGRAFNMNGTYLYRTGEDPEEAFGTSEDYLRQAIDLSPQSADPHSRLAELLAQWASWRTLRGKESSAVLDRAVESGRRATTLQKEMYSALHSLGTALTLRAVSKFRHGGPSEEDLLEAEATFERAMSLEPNSVTIPANMAEVKILQARILRKRGEDSEAPLRESLEYTETSFALVSGDHSSYFRRGKALMHLGWNALLQGEDPGAHLAAARRDLEKGLEHLPRIAGAWLELAETHLISALWDLARGESPRAAAQATILAARQALELDSNRSDGHRLIGLADLVRATAGEGDEERAAIARARGELERAIEMDPETGAHRIAFARLAWTAVKGRSLADTEAHELRRLGLDHAERAEGLDPAEAEATLLRGALLALDPTRREEGEALMASARQRNRRLVLDWSSPPGES